MDFFVHMYILLYVIIGPRIRRCRLSVKPDNIKINYNYTWEQVEVQPGVKVFTDHVAFLYHYWL